MSDRSEVRCPCCNKMLAVREEKKLVVKCARCKNKTDIDKDAPEAQRKTAAQAAQP